ncbi:sulfurtransferase [Synechococcus sp. GFB01]|uniref:sulfurtransferase n=1 Tax=Synechococcus sp. GFB01 TaxID=1662190 RepID=UPI00064E560D|nr:thiosulfate sulfurtransferase [Synechococcus sp. GFB01]
MSFSRRWFLAGTSALAITVLSPISAALPANARTEINLLSPAEASSAAQSGQWKILDVRPVPPLDYISGHLPNAVHLSEQAFRGPNGKLPFQIWPAGDLANLLSRAGISNRDKVLVYSDGTNVLGASLVAYILEKSGVSKVGILDGGFSAYKASGAPVTKVFPSYRFGTFKPTTTPGLAIGLQELLPLVGRPDVVIVDPRPKGLFEGTEQTFIRNGHIPGAINITWQSVTEANNPDEALKNPHKLKSVEALRKLFASHGVTPEKTVIVSCSTGREASLQYIVLKHLLGYPNVRIYEGSWTEYSATQHPVQTGPGASAVKN